jgi:ceramide glucosyltransferase
MTLAIWTAAAFCGFTTLIHLSSVIVAIVRCRPPAAPVAAPGGAPAVTIVRPVAGLENCVEETLRSSFALDYPRYELLICVASARDPIVPLVNRLIADHPQVSARLLIGDERVSGNPKLNNCVKGWNAARHDWIVLADCNVLMPRDYLQRLLSRWRAGTGLVCAPPIGVRPQGFFAELECAFLNTYQARWQYFADTLGAGFAQGKTMLWRRAELEAAGGIRALGAEIAEDAASTKVVRAAGLSVHLVDAPFGQPLGPRSARDVWRRQTRWARLRRACFPRFFLPELISGAFFPFLCAGAVAAAMNWSIAGSVAALAALWYGAEMALARAAGWPLPLLYPLQALVRDVLLPALWLDGLLGTGFEWRGHQMSVDADPAVGDSPTA